MTVILASPVTNTVYLDFDGRCVPLEHGHTQPPAAAMYRIAVEMALRNRLADKADTWAWKAILDAALWELGRLVSNEHTQAIVDGFVDVWTKAFKLQQLEELRKTEHPAFRAPKS